MCSRARKTKRYGQRVPIVSYYVGSLAATGSNFDLSPVRILFPLKRAKKCAIARADFFSLCELSAVTSQAHP